MSNHIAILRALNTREPKTAAEIHAATKIDVAVVAQTLLELLDEKKVEHRWICDGGCKFSGWRRKKATGKGAAV